MDGKVWHPRHHHLRQGKPVHLIHLKEGLKARGTQADWPQQLPWVLLNIRTAPKTDSNKFAAEVVYGAALTLLAQPPSPNETSPAAVDRQRAEAAIPTRVLPHPPPTEVPLHVYVRKVRVVNGCTIPLLYIEK